MAESSHLDKNLSPDERVCNWKALLARIGMKWAFAVSITLGPANPHNMLAGKGLWPVVSPKN